MKTNKVNKVKVLAGAMLTTAGIVSASFAFALMTGGFFAPMAFFGVVGFCLVDYGRDVMDRAIGA